MNGVETTNTYVQEGKKFISSTLPSLANSRNFRLTLIAKKQSEGVRFC